MKKPELLAPAGSPEGVRAAVQSGATAVYMGFGTFNARRGAKNFTAEQMEEAIRYCRARGVKTNITLNILAQDREHSQLLSDVKFLCKAGADALIVQDLGVAAVIRECAPDIQLHASTQMTVNTLDGAKIAKELGFSRVVLSRECTFEQIKTITENAGIETEVFVHGALCMCYSGQCYMSAMIGQRSGNRGLCAQPCRLPYRYDGTGKEKYALSLKDLSLADWLKELTEAGVSSLKIEGRMKRPEYAAIVTEIYARLLNEQRKPTDEERKILALAFSRDGFTDGYFTGKKGDKMFGTKTEVPMKTLKPLYDAAAARFSEGKENILIPVNMEFSANSEGIQLIVNDNDGYTVKVSDSEQVEQAKTRPTGIEQLEKSLKKTGGTPFEVKNIKADIQNGLMIPASRLNLVRRNALDMLYKKRSEPPKYTWNEPKPKEKSGKISVKNAEIIAMVTTEEQAKAVKLCGINEIYAPIELAAKVKGLIPVLPRVYRDNEQAEIDKLICECKKNGTNSVMIGNIGQILIARRHEMQIHGDFGLNVYNTGALDELKRLGVTRQVLSFELRFAQMRDLSKNIDTVLMTYGYMPLMIFENCVIRRKTGSCTCKKQTCYLTDRQGKNFALLPAFGCRNELINSQPLYLADKKNDCITSGAKYQMLRFTTENAEKCTEICKKAAMGESLSEEITRGLAYRGVE